MLSKMDLRKLQNSLPVRFSQVEEYEFESEKFEAICSDVRKRLDLRLKSGRCSTVLIDQIARHFAGLGERFQNKIEYYHGPSLCDVIGALEEDQLSGQAFQRSEKLLGLFKAHHSPLSQTHSILRNVLNAMPLNESYSLAKLNDFHTKILLQKESKKELTGEWIIYMKVGAAKYYLCLALHEEGKGDGASIYNRIKPCLDEFEELKFLKK